MKIKFNQDCELLCWNNTWTNSKLVVYKKDDEIDGEVVGKNFEFANGNVLWDINDLYTQVIVDVPTTPVSV